MCLCCAVCAVACALSVCPRGVCVLSCVPVTCVRCRVCVPYMCCCCAAVPLYCTICVLCYVLCYVFCATCCAMCPVLYAAAVCCCAMCSVLHAVLCVLCYVLLLCCCAMCSVLCAVQMCPVLCAAAVCCCDMSCTSVLCMLCYVCCALCYVCCATCSVLCVLYVLSVLCVLCGVCVPLFRQSPAPASAHVWWTATSSAQHHPPAPPSHPLRVCCAVLCVLSPPAIIGKSQGREQAKGKRGGGQHTAHTDKTVHTARAHEGHTFSGELPHPTPGLVHGGGGGVLPTHNMAPHGYDDVSECVCMCALECVLCLIRATHA